MFTVGNNQSLNNATGFSAFPAGQYYCDDPAFSYYVGYSSLGRGAYFWSATQPNDYDLSPDLTALYHCLSGNIVSRSFNGKNAGFSVRCLRDN